ncbi:MAG: metal ABC transporter permease [Oscillospiraceae bacterium]|nr:metal ABC transporter permease [Oscillospiraceae bacterium]
MIDELISMMTPEFVSYILVPALIGGIAVTLCSALLGVSLVLKRYSMIGDGLSHVGYGALSVAAVMNLAPLKVALPVVIAAAFILLRMNDNSKLKGDSAIAVFSTTALAIGILVSSKAGLTNDVSHYMFGSILAMDHNDVILSVVLSVLVLVIFVVFYNKIFAVTFDEKFSKASGMKVNFYKMLIALLTAVTVVLGMMMMGALLISSLIIFPAVTSMRIFRSFRAVVVSSAIVSVVCFLLGFFISLLFDTAPGASVVIVNVTVFGLFSLIGFLRTLGKKA